jgi:hypothetical protein
MVFLVHLRLLISMVPLLLFMTGSRPFSGVLLNVLGMMRDLMEREAKLLGLDAKTRNHAEPPPDRSHVQPTIWNLLAQAPSIDLETPKRIQELDPIEKPGTAKSVDVPGSADD